MHCAAGGHAQRAAHDRHSRLAHGRGRSDWRAAVPSLYYNAGRVISYSVVGGIAGGLGHVVSLTGIMKGIIPIVGGVFMVIMAINLFGIFPILRILNIRMPLFIAKKITKGNNYNPFYIGILSGLMPCGPLQIIQLYALGTRSVIYGAASSFVFALGTVPLLFAFGLFNSLINKKLSVKILKFSAVIVLVLGISMIGRGLSLYGILINVPGIEQLTSDETDSKIEGNIQTVTTEIKADSFPEILVKKGIPVKWHIKVTEENLNDCNNEIIIPKYKVDKKLKVGDNIIEFTPIESGDIPYTCWMGMIKSKIIVSDNEK